MKEDYGISQMKRLRMCGQIQVQECELNLRNLLIILNLRSLLIIIFPAEHI
jgi:hypothetical protein